MSNSLDEGACERLPLFLKSEITEKLPEAATQKINFEDGSIRDIVNRELQWRTAAVEKSGICTDHDKKLTIDEKTIVEVVRQSEGAATVLKALAQGLAAKGLAVKLTSKIEETDDQVTSLVERCQKAEQQLVDERGKVKSLERELLGAYRNQTQRENAPSPRMATETQGRKRKALEHPKRLSNGSDPSYEFWRRAMEHKIETDEADMPTPASQAAYIVSRCEGKAAEHLEPHLRAETYKEDPQGVFEFLKTLFDNSLLQMRAEEQFRRLFMRKDDSFRDFFLKFSKLAAEAEIPHASYKRELSRKITDELRRASAREAMDTSTTFEKYHKVVAQLAFVEEGITARENARAKRKKNCKIAKPAEKLKSTESRKLRVLQEVLSAGRELVIKDGITGAHNKEINLRKLVGGDHLLIPVTLSYSGLAIINKDVLFDTGADVYAMMRARVAKVFRDKTGAERVLLPKACRFRGYDGKNGTCVITHATIGHMTVDGRTERDVCFLEAPELAHDIIIGRLWLAKHDVDVSARHRCLKWPSQTRPSPYTRDLLLPQPRPKKINKTHHKEADRREKQLETDEKRGADGGGTMRILRTGASYEQDQKQAMEKMSRSLKEGTVTPPATLGVRPQESPLGD